MFDCSDEARKGGGEADARLKPLILSEVVQDRVSSHEFAKLLIVSDKRLPKRQFVSSTALST